MIEKVISHINTLGRDQNKLITFKYKHVRIIGYVETPRVGANSDEGGVKSPVVDYELEDEEMRIKYM